MSVKITTFEQVDSLKEGDILQKSPSYLRHEKIFGKVKYEDLVTYEIKNINKAAQSLNLEVRNNKDIFSWPSDLKRINIKAVNMLTDETWWIFQ